MLFTSKCKFTSMKDTIKYN